MPSFSSKSEHSHGTSTTGKHVADAKASVLRSQQQRLPRLPIPPLNDTLDRYLVKLRPLLSENDFAKTKKAVNDFRGESGQKLQKLLVEYDACVPDRSYVAEFWDDMYLGGRYPPIINSNPYLLLSDDPLIKNDQVTRVTQLLLSTAKFVNKLRLSTMKPDMQKDTPLDAVQYGSLFGTRIPTAGRDYMHIDNNARNVLIFRNSRLFLVQILTHDHVPLPADVIKAQLVSIIASSPSSPSTAPQFDLGAFTGGEREIWASTRKSLKAYDFRNRAAFDDIENAILGLSLESYSPTSQLEAALQTFHGYGKNRWFDKTNMWIAFGDGSIGYNFEHSPADGHTVLRYINDVWNDSESSKEALATRSATPANSSAPQPRELKFNFPANFENEIEKAGQAHITFINSNDHVLLPFTEYGADFIKSQKMSPDAYVQMAFQLAYYRTYKRPASTYESCSTKNYQAGRTETIRSVTDESVAFTSKFDDKNVTKEEKIALLLASCNAHVERAKLAQVGLGVDRHLYGLRHLAEMLNRQGKAPIPEIFKDKGYPTLSTSVISTSNLGTIPSLKLFGFGAVCEDGYGFGYMTNKNDIPITVSSWQRNSTGMRDTLQQSLRDMKNFF